MRIKKIGWLVLACLVMLTSCSLVGEMTGGEGEETSSSKEFKIESYGSENLKIVAGSENKVLEPIIQDYAKANKQNIEIDYLGSLDIMRLLKSGQVDYDAVWPASSIWLSLGDDHKLLKYAETTSITPVVFGIKKGLAEDLGFVGREVKMVDIMEAVQDGKLNFCMTSASQSNSGASAYLGFLTGLAGAQDGLSMEDLSDPQVRGQTTSFLSGVERSSGSSNWLVDLFLQGDYDAMVNYETLIIQTNQVLEERGEDPLYMVYPVDGLSISDSPLAYVDKGDEGKEAAFLSFQDYILSDEAQGRIEETGKRSAYGTVREENEDIYREDWGVDLNRILTPIRWPKADVIMEALSLYQGEFKKPALTVYVLDYSGSMSGEGASQMNAALDQVLVPDNAKTHLLLGTGEDLTYLVPFAGSTYGVDFARGNGQELLALYETSQTYETGGGTALYEALETALGVIEGHGEDLKNYTPAIVVLTDGMPNGYKNFSDLEVVYQDLGLDIPIFSILYGHASEPEMEKIAEMTRARVFDGRDDLVGAFKSVKGYN